MTNEERARKAAEKIHEWSRHDGMVDGKAINEVAAIILETCFREQQAVCVKCKHDGKYMYEGRCCVDIPVGNGKGGRPCYCKCVFPQEVSVSVEKDYERADDIAQRACETITELRRHIAHLEASAERHENQVQDLVKERWVTLGTIKIDRESETETFNRLPQEQIDEQLREGVVPKCGCVNPGGIPCTMDRGHLGGHDLAAYGPHALSVEKIMTDAEWRYLSPESQHRINAYQKEIFPQEVDTQERIAQLTAHRACCNEEHDPGNGKIAGFCVVCGVPWPCTIALPSVEDEQKDSEKAEGGDAGPRKSTVRVSKDIQTPDAQQCPSCKVHPHRQACCQNCEDARVQAAYIRGLRVATEIAESHAAQDCRERDCGISIGKAIRALIPSSAQPKEK